MAGRHPVRAPRRPPARCPGRGARVGLLLLCMLAGSAPAARAGYLIGVRTWPWEDRFRIVLDLSGPTDHVDRVVTGPDRIAINLRDTRAGEVTLPVTRDWMVRGIRLNRLKNGTAQVVLDLHTAPSFRIFELGAADGKPFRVVCDVYRAKAAPVPEGAEPWVVMIDPGHGGRDPGAVHRGLIEKRIVLDVAQRLSQVLQEEPGVAVYLTRERDRFVPLKDRVARLEETQADVFVSIHVNGCPSRSARGAEVFYLSLRGATNAAARELAELENAAESGVEPLLGEIANLPFGVDLVQTDTVLRSSLLAECVLDRLTRERLAATRGVKQANFVVLRSMSIPSALVELGFISNPSDGERLASSAHRQALAEAIAKGLLEFRRRFARKNAAAGLSLASRKGES